MPASASDAGVGAAMVARRRGRGGDERRHQPQATGGGRRGGGSSVAQPTRLYAAPRRSPARSRREVWQRLGRGSDPGMGRAVVRRSGTGRESEGVMRDAGGASPATVDAMVTRGESEHAATAGVVVTRVVFPLWLLTGAVLKLVDSARRNLPAALVQWLGGARPRPRFRAALQHRGRARGGRRSCGCCRGWRGRWRWPCSSSFLPVLLGDVAARGLELRLLRSGPGAAVGHPGHGPRPPARGVVARRQGPLAAGRGPAAAGSGLAVGILALLGFALAFGLPAPTAAPAAATAAARAAGGGLLPARLPGLAGAALARPADRALRRRRMPADLGPAGSTCCSTARTASTATRSWRPSSPSTCRSPTTAVAVPERAGFPTAGGATDARATRADVPSSRPAATGSSRPRSWFGSRTAWSQCAAEVECADPDAWQ